MRSLLRCVPFLFLFHAGAARAGVTPQNVVFVTSTYGSADLSSWGADAGGQSGVAAGDAICQARWDDAHPSEPRTFKAWLSDDANDAFCRIQGFTGEKGSNCGQGDVPNLAGPWMVIGGLPFGGKIVDLVSLSPQVYYPVRYNEFGNPVSGPVEIWTGTFGNGEGFGTCGDFDSESGQGYVGSFERTGFGWTAAELQDCDLDAHLLCMETGVGDPLPPIKFFGRLAFVTSAFGDANLGEWPEAGSATGVDAADAICRNLATTAGLLRPDGFKAWLSDSQTDAIDRFARDGPIMRLDHALIANHLDDLVDENLHTPLNQTEDGTYLGSEVVWTSTWGDGVAFPPFCEDWTDELAAGGIRVGIADDAGPSWSSALWLDCDYATGHLYCIQDLPLVFADDFESGNTMYWSTAAL